MRQDGQAQHPAQTSPAGSQHIAAHYTLPVVDGDEVVVVVVDEAAFAASITESATFWTFCDTFSLMSRAAMRARSRAWSRFSPIVRFSNSVLGAESPIAAPTATAMAPAASGYSCTQSSTDVLAVCSPWRADCDALRAAVRTRSLARRAPMRADSAYSPTVSRALLAYSPTVSFADAVSSPTFAVSGRSALYE